MEQMKLIFLVNLLVVSVVAFEQFVDFVPKLDAKSRTVDVKSTIMKRYNDWKTTVTKNAKDMNQSFEILDRQFLARPIHALGSSEMGYLDVVGPYVWSVYQAYSSDGDRPEFEYLYNGYVEVLRVFFECSNSEMLPEMSDNSFFLSNSGMTALNRPRITTSIGWSASGVANAAKPMNAPFWSSLI